MIPAYLRIGARGSPLSLTQTGHVRAMLAAALSVDPESLPITPITTTGDRIQDRRLLEAGGKGLFTKELDEALLDGRIDLAVHSLKDLPTKLPPGIVLAATPEREDPRDAFLSTQAASLEELPQGALVGTASLRRQAQTLFARPDLRIATLRGNVDTRLAKLAAGEADATFLALAGLKRLGLAAHARGALDPIRFPPAVGQGALAITALETNAEALAACAAVDDAATRLAISAERGFLEALDGSCRTPIAAYARLSGSTLSLVGEALTPDGAHRWRREGSAPVSDAAAAAAFGFALGAAIKAEAGDMLPRDAG